MKVDVTTQRVQHDMPYRHKERSILYINADKGFTIPAIHRSQTGFHTPRKILIKN